MLHEIRHDVRSVLVQQATHAEKIDHVVGAVVGASDRLALHDERIRQLERHRFMSLGLAAAATSLAGVLLAFDRLKGLFIDG